jgi:tetratricopeptide (TPR) repeat protein
MSSVLVLLFMASAAPDAAAANPLPRAAADRPVADNFVEPVIPLVPRQERTEQQRAAVTAAALYAHGRLLLRRDDQAGALRRFQRAWRYDPRAVSLLPQIVFLAHHLGRPDEAARYAVLAAERDQGSPTLLQQLALQLSRQQDWPRAIQLLEKSLQPVDGDLPADASAGLSPAVARLELGRLYFLSGDFPRSAEHFAHVRQILADPGRLAADPTLEKILLEHTERTYQMLAESFYQAGRYEEARAMLTRVQAARQSNRKEPKASDEQPLGGPDTPSEPSEQAGGVLDYDLARVAAKLGQRDQAQTHLEAYFASRSAAAGTAPYELMAELMSGSEQQPVGVATGSAADTKPVGEQGIAARLEELLQADPKNPALLWYTAQRDLAHQQFEPARQRLEQLLVLQPGLAAYQGLIEIHRQRRLPAELLGVLGVAAACGANTQDFQDLLAPLTDDPALSRDLVDAAVHQLDNQAEGTAAGVLLAGALLAEERAATETADRLFSAGVMRLDRDARYDWLVDWGLELLLDERFAAAADAFRQALADPPSDAGQAACQFYLIRALALADQTDQALQAARRGAELFPDQPRLQSQPGWVLYHARRYDAAEAAYRELLQQFDALHTPEVRSAMREARLILSNICVHQQRLPEAEQWLEQILDEYPEDVGALNDLGYLWADQGQWLERSLAMIQRAVEQEPDNVAYRDSLGWAYYRLDRYAEALAELEQAASGDDPDGVILEHLGDTYYQLGQRQQALDTWRRALQALADETDEATRRNIRQKIKNCEK